MKRKHWSSSSLLGKRHEDKKGPKKERKTRENRKTKSNEGLNPGTKVMKPHYTLHFLTFYFTTSSTSPHSYPAFPISKFPLGTTAEGTWKQKNLSFLVLINFLRCAKRTSIQFSFGRHTYKQARPSPLVPKTKVFNYGIGQ